MCSLGTLDSQTRHVKPWMKMVGSEQEMSDTLTRWRECTFVLIYGNRISTLPLLSPPFYIPVHMCLRLGGLPVHHWTQEGTHCHSWRREHCSSAHRALHQARAAPCLPRHADRRPKEVPLLSAHFKGLGYWSIPVCGEACHCMYVCMIP